jgi:hypothetical protein
VLSRDIDFHVLMSSRNTAKLEQKIESLVALLANTQGMNLNLEQLTPPESHSQVEMPPAQEVPTTACSGPTIPWEPLFTRQNLPTSPRTQVPSGSLQIQGTTILHVEHPATPSRQHFSSSIWTLSDHESEVLLTKFRECFIPHFPFITIPSSMSTAELKVHRPHLLKAAWTVAFQDNRKRQIEMGKDLMVDISTSMLVRGERDLDMLQSLILMNAWYVLSQARQHCMTCCCFNVRCHNH